MTSRPKSKGGDPAKPRASASPVGRRPAKAVGKTTSKEIAALAAKVLGGYRPTRMEMLALAGTALGQTVRLTR